MSPRSIRAALQRRRTILALIVIGLVPAFLLTNAAVHAARGRRQQFATEWARRGDRELATGRPASAAEDYRTAQQYARDANEFRLQLAQALVAADEPVQAAAQLLTLWSRTPGDGGVNLELGRIAAHQGEVADAIRYYHAAIDGAWDRDPLPARRRARIELATFLLGRGALVQAQAELIALLADLPPDANRMADVAELLLKASANDRALTLLQQALDLDPANVRALRLAGEAAFRLGDYRAARTYLRDASVRTPLDADTAKLLDLSTRVVALDPFTRGITSRERLRRALRAFDVASEWIAGCSAPEVSGLQAEVAAARPKQTERTLARDPDAVDATLALVSKIETTAARACGAGTPDAQALLLVLRQRRATT